MDYEALTPEQLEDLAIEMFSPGKSLNFGVGSNSFTISKARCSSPCQPFILGSAIDALLCGILLMQCVSYVGSSARDGWRLKGMVAYVIAMNLCVFHDIVRRLVSSEALETFSWSTAFAWAWVWELFVRNFGTYVRLSRTSAVVNAN
jgi:hypothetical protein